MVDGTTTTKVDILASGDISKTLADIVARINGIGGTVTKIISESNKAATAVDAKFQKAADGLLGKLQQIERLEKAITAQQRSGITNLNQDRSFSGQVQSASIYAQTLKSATSAAEGLQARLNDIQKKMSATGSAGGLVGKNDLAKQLNTEKAIAELKALDRQLDTLKNKARQSGGAFSSEQRGVFDARAALSAAVLNPRRSNFAAELGAVADAQKRLEVGVGRLNTLTNNSGSITLKSMKEQAILRAQEAAQSGSLDAAREASALRLRTLRESLNGAGLAQQRMLQEAIQIERAHNGEIEKQIRLRNQSTAAAERANRVAATQHKNNAAVGPNGPIIPPATPAGGASGGGILPSGGLGTVLARTAAYGGAAAAIYGTIGALKDGADFAIKFQDALARLSAIAGATDGQMTTLRTSILEVGRNSRFATLEIAEAATVLAQAGFTTSEIGQSLQSISELATASGSTFAEATDLATAAVGSFQLQTSELGNISSSLVAALNRTKLTVQQVALGIQYAGTTAFENKITFEELTSIFATLANAGIRSGSTQGTGTRQFLVDLIDPSKKLLETLKSVGLGVEDIDVKTLGIDEVLTRLAAAGFGATEAYRGLETRAAATYLVLRNNLPALFETQAAMANMTAATEGAARGADSFSAEWQKFKNNINEDVSGGIGGLVEGLQYLLHDFNELSKIDASAPMVKLKKAYSEGTISGSEFRAEQERIYNTAKESDAAIQSYAAALDMAKTNTNNTTEAVTQQAGVLDSLDAAISKVYLRQATLQAGSGALALETANLSAKFGNLAMYLDGATNSAEGLIGALRRLRAEELATMGARLRMQETALNQEIGVQAARGGRAIGQARRLTEDPRVHGLLNRVRNNQTDTNAVNQLAEYARRLPPGPLRDQLFEVTGARSSIQNAQLGIRRNLTSQGAVGAAESRGGQRITQRVQALNKPGTSQAEIARVEKVLLEQIGSDKLTGGQKQFLIDTLQDVQALKSGAPPPEKAAGGGRKDRGGGGAARAERDQDNRTLKIAQATLKGANFDLEDALREAEAPLDRTQIENEAAKVQEQLNNWVTARTAVMEAEIDKSNFSDQEADVYRREVGREIKAKQEEVARSLRENFEAMIKAMADATERAIKETVTPAEQNLAVAQGTRAGLDRESLRNKVPDYIRQNEDRKVGRAEEELDAAELEGKRIALKGLTDQLAEYDLEVIHLRQQQKDANNPLLNNVAIKENTDKIYELKQAIIETRGEIAAAEAAMNAGDLVPTTLTGAFSQAAEAYREAHNLGQSFKDNVIGSMTESLETLHGGLTTFFTDILTGSKSASEAFGDFARSMINYIAQMLAKWLAAKALGLILSAIGGGTGEGGALPGLSIEAHEGGPMPKYAGGGSVRLGIPNRDTVPALLSKGEYVVRKQAVDSVGDGFMKRLNNQGAGALKNMRETVVMPTAKQETNVFVVRPESAPPMGRNDVLVTIQDDILNDGQTKKLIRHVAQGG